MFKLATILDNPGEPSAATRYRDPKLLRDLGYNGVVLYQTTALSGLKDASEVPVGELRRWVEQVYDAARRQTEQAREAGLAVYLAYDAITLPRAVVEANPEPYLCKGRQPSLCPASDATLQRSGEAMASLLGGFPDVAGVVLRFGDSDAARLPHLIGNDLYAPHCPQCGHMSRADRIVRAIEHFYRIAVEQGGRRLIVRAWNVQPHGMHDAPALSREVAARLPGDPDDDRLVLSFKFTQTDFWRYQRWNPSSLAIGPRPVIYEVECQREFEGKGAMPNWQAPLWRDGAPEAAVDPDADPAQPTTAVRGLAQAADLVRFAGLWAWVRGGGWGGPFISDETWIDANVYAVPRLADDPQLDLHDLARSWIVDRLGVDTEVVTEKLLAVLQGSPEVILKGFYVAAFARQQRDGWRPNADWITDDLLDADAAWRIIQRLPERDLDEVIAEKQWAVERIGRDRAALAGLMTAGNQKTLEPLVSTLAYAESFFLTLRDLMAGLVAYRRWQRKGDRPDPALREQCRLALLAAQSHWNHHTQRHGSLPGAATSFREHHFWDLTQRLLAELGDG